MSLELKSVAGHPVMDRVAAAHLGAPKWARKWAGMGRNGPLWMGMDGNGWEWMAAIQFP